QHAKVIWSTVHVATGLTPPRSVTHMLGNWLQHFNAQEAITILTGAIFRGAYWLRFWSMLQHEEKTKELFMKASTTLEMVALELFATHGWKHNNRLCQA
ncbi:unnamed protein product, partial [Urochloa humidicola]